MFALIVLCFWTNPGSWSAESWIIFNAPVFIALWFSRAFHCPSSGHYMVPFIAASPFLFKRAPSLISFFLVTGFGPGTQEQGRPFQADGRPSTDLPPAVQSTGSDRAHPCCSSRRQLGCPQKKSTRGRQKAGHSGGHRGLVDPVL